MKQERIVKVPKGKKIIKAAASYLWRYVRKKPLVMNLNLNVTNLCNQNCPMCNAVIVGKGTGRTITYDEFRIYMEKLAPYKIASLTVSGGEPSLVKDISDILEYAASRFPFGVNVNSNLYAREEIITRFAETALKHDIRIGTSFDGFDDIADRLRGAKNVSKRVLKSIELLTQMRKDLRSNSTLNMHTVISDQNIDQIPEILDISEKFGWSQTLAPVNNFYYQDADDPNTPALHYSDKLEEVIRLATTKKNIAVSKDFLQNIPAFIKGESYKLCPYTTGIFKVFKIFIDPNGDFSLCSREAIGNINTDSIEDILKKAEYKQDVANYQKCPGCWMACFVEILLAMPGFYRWMIRTK